MTKPFNILVFAVAFEVRSGCALKSETNSVYTVAFNDVIYGGDGLIFRRFIMLALIQKNGYSFIWQERKNTQ